MAMALINGAISSFEITMPRRLALFEDEGLVVLLESLALTVVGVQVLCRRLDVGLVERGALGLRDSWCAWVEGEEDGLAPQLELDCSSSLL